MPSACERCSFTGQNIMLSSAANLRREFCLIDTQFCREFWSGCKHLDVGPLELLSIRNGGSLVPSLGLSLCFQASSVINSQSLVIVLDNKSIAEGSCLIEAVQYQEYCWSHATNKAYRHQIARGVSLLPCCCPHSMPWRSQIQHPRVGSVPGGCAPPLAPTSHGRRLWL